MEILQLVRVRGERWHVVDVRAYETCRLVTLASAEPQHGGTTRRVLTPFDRMDVVRRRERPRVASPRLWRRACRGLIAANAPPGTLRTARTAAIDLLPHQLEPALAMLRGAASRVLLADDVGLGKTIQASLIVGELLARDCIDRVLVVTPAGVREQWADELRSRFGIAATLADARSLRERGDRLPVGLNPWTTVPIAIASLDYIKRPEVLPAVLECRWDAVVVDEAHAAAVDTDRHAAVHALAQRAAYVVLLTATPHSGDPRAFAALCAIGASGTVAPAYDDSLIVFRRTRHHVRGETPRRTHVLRVGSRRAERQMYAALAAYERAARAEHGDRALALTVLDKRAYSSAWSLMRSVERRLTSLAATGDQRTQLALPLDDPDGELSADDGPPAWPEALDLADTLHERALLDALREAARAAARDESKVAVIRRLLRRTVESALIFTEYRDTALHLRDALGVPASILHGGLDREKRSDVVARFCRGAERVLIATDAAGQGLNLHAACRLVVNLELPWNPMRLEQRIGRVDRIGQQRRVHAFHLVASGTGEERILSRLKTRIDVARADVDAPDPFESRVRPRADASPVAARTRTVDLASDAAAEVTRIAAARTLTRSGDDVAARQAAGSGPWSMRARRSPVRAALNGRSLFIWMLRCHDADGRCVEAQLVSIATPRPGRGWNGAPAIPATLMSEWRVAAEQLAAPFRERRLYRERAINAERVATSPSLFQPALFDRRAERTHEQVVAAQTDSARERAARLARLERQSSIGIPVAELLLVIAP